MTLRNRLILTIIGIAVLLVLPALFAVKQLERVRDIAATQGQRISRANLALGRLQTRIAELDRYQRGWIVNAEAEQREGMYESLTNARVHLTNLGSYGFAEVASPAGQWLDSLETATRQVDALMLAGERDEATQFFEAVKPLFAAAQDTLSAIADQIDAQSQSELREAQLISAAAMTSTLLALAICLALAIALGLYTTRVLNQPITRLRRAMSTVAAGDFVLAEELPYHRADEIGDVARSFRSMTQRLADLDRLKAEFLSIATHELKTPINVIGGYAELMQERVYGDVSDKQEEALQSIREQTQIMTALVNQLLDISRLEAGGMKLELQIVPPPELLARVERSFAPLAQKQGISFRVHIDHSVPSAIETDVDRVRDQVFGNLLGNALKFTEPGGSIEVRAHGDADWLHVEVSDTGVGIPADKLPFIFEKFYQIGEDARRKGAGLGLAIAREVVEAHAGRITAESEPGRGTSFFVSLPRQPRRRLAPPEPAAVRTG